MTNDSDPLDVIPVDQPIEQPVVVVRAEDSPAVMDVKVAEMPAALAVPEADRIQSIDVLRGFALLGILVMNIQSFSMIEAAYGNPTAYGSLEGANYWVWLLSHVLADQKFMTIFSMLFGAGVVLMTSRQEEASGRSAAVHYRRMGVLAIFGVLHAYLFWYGDILFGYALCGMLVYLCRRLRPFALLLIGFFSVALPALFVLAIGGILALLLGAPLPDRHDGLPQKADRNMKPDGLPQKPDKNIKPNGLPQKADKNTKPDGLPQKADKNRRVEIREELEKSWRPPPQRVAAEVAAYRGNWVSEFRQRWPTSLIVETLGLAFFVLWRAGGLMLVGMALFKRGVFSARRSAWFYLALIALALCVGVPLILLGVSRNEQASWDAIQGKFLNGLLNYWGSILVSLGWVGLIMLICKQRSLRLLTLPLAAVGQMALTNYLLHTLICTTIFYGHGFGLFGQVERVGQIEIVFAIWAFQLIVSPIWLHFFRFGPAEWVWRGLTYLHVPPLLRT